MPLNTDFWNAAQEDYPSRYGMKRFTKTYKELILDGDLPLNQEWDKTISPWAISPRMGENAHYQNDLINRCWLYPDINTMKGISDSQPWEEDYIIKTSIAAHPQHEFPFITMFGDGGQSVALPNPGWTGRISPDQEATDANFGNVKTMFYMLTAFEYSRLVWLIKVFVASDGYNSPNYSVSRWNWGSWYDLGDITDEMYTDILSGNKSITGIKFVPYYAGGESNPNSRVVLNSFGFLSLADTQPLDGSASGLGINAPYTTDYIDYALTAFANYATSDYENNSYTFSLGSTGNDVYHNNFRCKINGSTWFDSTVEWAEGRPSWGVDGNFTESRYNNGIGTDSTFWKMEGLNGSGNWMYMYYRQRLDESLLNTKEKIRDYILTQAAYLGCWFAERSAVTSSGEMSKNNPDAYIGVIESDGLTHGQYQKGSEIDAPNADWVNPWEDSPYVPYVPDPDPTDWDEDQTSVLETTTGDPSYGTREYLMTETALVQLLKALEELKVGEAEGDIASGYCEKAFGYTDPIKAIVSVIKYPFDMINDWLGSGLVVSGSDVGSWFSIANAQIAVSIGTSPAIYEIVIPSAHDIYEISWGATVWKYGRASLPYFQKFENFLAYEPYCTAVLYVPFAGSVRLDPEVYVSHSVGVEYYVSPLDGTCKAYILRDNLVIDTLTGNIGTSIEINSSDDLAKANNINLLNSNIQAQKMNLLKQAASFSVGSAVNAGLNPTTGAASMVRSAVDLTFSAMQAQNTIDRLEYQIETTQTPFKQLQPGGGYLSSCDEWGVRLVAYRPEPLIGYSFDNWKEFPTLCGFACLLNDTLDNFTGFTKCATVKLDGIAATAQEKQQIRKLLQSGVYL